MRIKDLAFAATFLLTSISSAGAPQTPSPTPSPLQRDPQALMALGQMVAAAGWTASTVPATIVASGTLTRPGAGQQAPASFIIKQRGPAQHRMDLQDSGTTSTTVVNGLAGAIRLPDGTKQRLPGHGALSIQSPVFPFLSDLVNTADLSVAIQDLGTKIVDGTSCHGVAIMRHASSADSFAQFRDLASPLKVWVSLQSALPVRIDFIRLADDNPYLAMNFSRTFSDYRLVNGIAVPFQQSESFEGQLMYQIQFTAVQFNVTLTDTDFNSAAL